ncbi:MAG TPA: EVE domain-containing protein [Haliangiales bacterium]|nr:EVE domain-containing protein [Haliangiales bacterium]
MATWLLKTEPSEYSWDDLVRAGKGTWDGVANPVALKHLAAAAKGDLAIIYHTGGERRAVGVAEIAGAPYPDPKDPKLTVVDIKPRAPLARPVGLDAIKAHPAFADSPLVKIGRLSVVPLTAAQWKTLLALAKTRL